MGSSKMWDARPICVTKSHNCVKCGFLKMGSSKMWDARPGFVTKSHNCVKCSFLKMGSSKMWDARPRFVTKSHNCVKCSFLKMGSSKMWDARPRFCPAGTHFSLKTLNIDTKTIILAEKNRGHEIGRPKLVFTQKRLFWRKKAPAGTRLVVPSLFSHKNS